MTDFADLIVTARQVRTLDPANPIAGAVAIKGSRIVAVGEQRDVADLRGGRTEVVDLGDATLTPGFVDGHMHPVMGLTMTDGLALLDCKDVEDLQGRLRRAADGLDGDDWVRGWGLDPNLFGGAPILSAAIDDAVGGRPALLTLFDGHSALASTEALRRAGIDGPRTFASNSVIVCGADGRPTGHLLEEGAIRPVQGLVPVESDERTVDRLIGLLDGMAASGLTGGHVMDLEERSLRLLTLLDGSGRLPLRLRLAPWRRPDDDKDRRAEIRDWQGRSGELWNVGAVKLFMDGTIDGGTAWLDEPDCFGESTHAYWRDPHDYTEAVREYVEAGIQTATHAIGDAAVAHVLRALAQVVPHGSSTRHRIEHIETLPSELIEQFVAHGVAASMQPTHATDYTRADHSDNWSHRLGDERADRGWRCRSLADAGVLLVLGSDWPIAPYDPRGIIAAAQLRRPVDQPELAPVVPAEAMTAEQALAGYTEGPARVAGAEHEAGRIAVGYRADLSAWGLDPVTAPADEFAQSTVPLTVTDGVVRHRL